MSISLEAWRVDYIGNGTQSVFSYAFKIFLESDLKVTVRNTTSGVETELTLTTDYTVSGEGETNGGNVTLVDAGQAWLDGDGDLDTGYVMTIKRAPNLKQETDIRNQGNYFPEVVEDQFDRQVLIDQKQQEEIDRSIKLPETQTDADFDPSLPTDFAGQADKALVTNSSGDGFETGPTTDEIANAQAYSIDADEHKQTAERWANLTTDSVTDVDTGVDSGEYSAKAYAIGGTEVTETAGKGAAKEWATKTDNLVDTVDYSAKEYAQGVQAGAGGSSKAWAQETASDVDGVDYSSKEYAIGIQNRGVAGGGSAKDWAQHVGTTVDDTEFSSKKYAQDSAASAAQSATSAAASLWQDVVYKVFGDSPVAIVDGDAGKLFVVDCTGGNVVINLPSIAILTLTGPWSVGIQKGDSSANTITINADGTDEIDGAASITLTKANATATLIPDTDPTPDEWSAITVGEYPVTGDLVGTNDPQVITNKDNDGGTASNTNRFSAPKNTTANLALLTNKEAVVAYDTTLGAPVYNDGAGWNSFGGGTSYSAINVCENLGLSASVAANALTINLKQGDGSTDPSAVAPVRVGFRATTEAGGGFDSISVTSAVSLVISSGSTLGHSSGIAENIFVYLINDGGTAKLAASSKLYDDSELKSAVAEGGAGAADSATELYATAIATSKPIKYLGRLQVNQTTAGTWLNVPAKINIEPERIGYQYRSTQYFTSNGSWTQPDGCLGIEVEVIGGGGSGGGASATAAGQYACTSGGGGGGYSRKFITMALNATETLVVGAGGAAPTGGAGATGGTTAFGAHLQATGGVGGLASAASTGVRTVDGREGGVGSLGDLNTKGSGSGYGFSNGSITMSTGSHGGSSVLGGGAVGIIATGTQAGVAGGDYGGGGSGSVNGPSNSAQTGGAGAGGIIIVKEFY